MAINIDHSTDTLSASSGTVSISGAVTVPNNSISNAELAQVSTATIKGRTTAGTGNVEDLTATQATALLDTFTSGAKGLAPASGGGTTNFLRADGSWAAPVASVSDGDKGDITVSAGGATWTIDANAVTNADLAQVATATFKGRTTAGTGNVEDLTATQATALLDTFTTSLKGLAPASGGGTSNYLRADGTWAAPAGGSSPNWHGVVYGAYGDCNPQTVLRQVQNNGVVSPTPTNISTSVARIAYFIPPANITVNRIRFYGVGATTNVYRVAIYNGDTLARLTAELAFTTAATTWGSAGSALNLSLTADQLYFIAVAVNATGTTAGPLAIGPTAAATTGQIAVLPKSYPGSLDIDNKYITGAFAQFAVTTGALPTTAATIAAQGAWTGGMPAFWLDSNNAA